MSLNNISLPPSLVAELYKSALVESPAGEIKNETVVPVPGKHWKYLGNNKKNILVVVHYNDFPILPDNELAFLSRMLSACKLNLDDVAVVNRHNHTVIFYKEYAEHFNCKTVLLFGIEPGSFGLPLIFPEYQVQHFSGCDFLFTPAMEILQKDELLRTKLWVCLKKMFNI
jgi:hypothetical protein